MATNPSDYINPVDIRTSQYANTPDTMLDGGLTKREHFAAMAMQGLMASNFENGYQSIESVEFIANLAVRQADALIAELNKEGEK